MKQLKSLLALTLCGALTLANQSCSQKNDETQLNSPDGTALTLDASTGLIKTAVPERPDGQQDVVALRLEPMDSV